MSQKIELALLVGAESKAWLRDLTAIVERLEKASTTKTGKTAKATEVDEDDEIEAAADDEDEDFAPKKKKAKKTTSFDDDDAEIEAATDDEDEEETDTFSARTAKEKSSKKKAPKITRDDVNDACKAYAASFAKGGREQVLKVLRKKFKTETISDIDPKQYEAVIEALAVEDEE